MQIQKDPQLNISDRTKEFVSKPARVDMDLFMEAAKDLYDPVHNPDGKFILNVAENMLSAELIRKQCNEVLKSKEIPQWVLNYTHPLGHPEVREIVGRFMNLNFKSSAITADTIAFSAGAAASLEVISFVLANPGDLVVIPAPAYPMYTNDLGIKSGVERYDLHTHYQIKDKPSLALVDVDVLEKTLAETQENGDVFKILLLTTPDNPSGSMYSEMQLAAIADWCITNKVHLLVNEIYAFSKIESSEKSSQDSFFSFASIMKDRRSEYLHLLYALSKDFCMSGMRFGIIHSLNESLMKALESVNIPHMVSNLTQWLVAEMFSDTQFIESYLIENKFRISKAYSLVEGALSSLDIPFIPAEGALFVWADFSKYLQNQDVESEMLFWEDLYHQTGVLITPGQGFGHKKPGLFRIVYTAHAPGHLEEALKKLSDYFQKK